GGGPGHLGGSGEGGAVMSFNPLRASSALATLTLSNCLILANRAVGGTGAAGGGNGVGGGVCNLGNTNLSISASLLVGNEALGGAGGLGAKGGDGLGGGIATRPSFTGGTAGTVTIADCPIPGNERDGGNGGTAGHRDDS